MFCYIDISYIKADAAEGGKPVRAPSLLEGFVARRRAFDPWNVEKSPPGLGAVAGGGGGSDEGVSGRCSVARARALGEDDDDGPDINDDDDRTRTPNPRPVRARPHNSHRCPPPGHPRSVVCCRRHKSSPRRRRA